MDKFLTLTSLRRVVQVFSFVVLVYGALFFTTFYSDDKLTQAFPSLTCAYDQQSGDYCVLIPLQHKVHHGVDRVLDGNIMQTLIPLGITIGTFALLIIILNKAFCGWTCPLGFFQEMISIVGRKLGIKQLGTISKENIKKIRPVKWLIFAFLVLIFPLMAGLNIVGHEMGNPFCNICPSRILTTLAVGDASQLYVDNSNTTYLILSLIADFLFGLMIALALFVKQPFCRICPILPMQTIFKKLGLFRLVKVDGSKCDSCNNCVKACPMDIFEIQAKADGKQNITYEDCTLCGKCVEFCPDNDVLRLEYAGIAVFKSSNYYFKKRNKFDKMVFKK